MQPFSVFGLTPYAVTGCHPFHGFQLPFLFLRGVPHPTLPRGVLHRLAMGMSPVSRALNAARLRSPTARQIPICYPSSTYNTSIFNCRVNKTQRSRMLQEYHSNIIGIHLVTVFYVFKSFFFLLSYLKCDRF